MRQCTCWAGYKRVPGTKPCEKNSCTKIKSVRNTAKKRSNKRRSVKKSRVYISKGK